MSFCVTLGEFHFSVKHSVKMSNDRWGMEQKKVVLPKAFCSLYLDLFAFNESLTLSPRYIERWLNCQISKQRFSVLGQKGKFSPILLKYNTRDGIFYFYFHGHNK